MAVDAVVAKFAVKIVEAVDTGDVFFETVAVIAVFAEVGVGNEVTVFAGAGIVNIVAINEGAVDFKVQEWDGFLEFVELFEERAVEVEVAAVVGGVELVAVKAIAAVYGVGAARLKFGDDFFVAESASGRMQIEFITNGEAALLATAGTKGRWRDFVFLAIKNW